MLILQKIKYSDFKHIYKLTQNIKIMSWIANGRIWDKNKVNKWLKYNNDNNKSYKIIYNNKFIGLIWIKTLDSDLTIIINNNYHGKGIGTETIKLFNKKLKEHDIKS